MFEKKNEDTAVEDEVLSYCIAGQITEPTTILCFSEDGVSQLLSTKEIEEVQANDDLYLNFSDILKKERVFYVIVDGSRCKKDLTENKLYITVLEL